MIKLDKVSKDNKNYKYKIIISFFVYSLSIIFTIIAVHYKFSQENQLEKFRTESRLQSDEKILLYKTFLEKRRDSILAIKENPYFLEYITKKQYQNNTDYLFFTIMQENKEYMQLRYIDTNGYEKIRFDRKIYAQDAYKINILQNKYKREYFQETIKLKNNEIYYSQINYNQENGKVQKPLVPVIRVATPVYVRRKLEGILIVNIFANKFINILSKSPLYDILIVDKNSIIKEKKQIIDIENLNNSTLNLIKDIKKNKILKEIKTYIEKVTISNKTIYIVYKLKNKINNATKLNNIKMTIVILVITIFLSIPFIFILGRPIKNMFEIVILQADKLHKLATNLDKLVKEETLKNTKKDRMLQHQSKLAELGEMISNIAHQWKHPLARLSLLSQNLKLYKEKNKLTDEIFFDTITKGNEQIDFMVNTIDNFRDFYKTNKEEGNFYINNCIKDINNILGEILKHNNIELTVNDNNVMLFGVKNELSQVLLNIIVNAKDAFIEKKIQKPTININIYEENSYKIISIQDNAGGIKQDIIKEIFNPYFTTKEDKGTGIGLYMSKTIIVENLKGTIEVQNIDDGAVFIIKI
jgi:signal transduction histidine kinase